MKHDSLTPCGQPSPLGGLCGDTPTRPYLTGPACRFCAPGATADACQHGTPWADRCGRCEGEPPRPSQRPSPSATREQHAYGPSADYSGLQVTYKTGRRWQVYDVTERAPDRIIKQRHDLNDMAYRATNERTTP